MPSEIPLARRVCVSSAFDRFERVCVLQSSASDVDLNRWSLTSRRVVCYHSMASAVVVSVVCY